MSDFANEVLARSLGELRGRRAKLETFIREAGELDTAIKEMERVCRKLGVGEGSVPRPVAAAPARAPREAGGESQPAKALACLRAHPRGLAANVVARETGIPANSVSAVLAGLMRDGQIERLGRGFYKASDAEAVAG